MRRCAGSFSHDYLRCVFVGGHSRILVSGVMCVARTTFYVSRIIRGGANKFLPII